MMMFDEQEIRLLILALRFWRAQRRDGAMRHTDAPIPPQTIETLLAKLESGRFLSRSARRHGEPGDPFGELFSR